VAILHDDSLPLDGLTAADLVELMSGLGPRWQRFRTQMAVLNSRRVSCGVSNPEANIHPFGFVNAKHLQSFYRSRRSP